MNAHRTIFAAVTAARGKRPHSVEIGLRPDAATGKMTPDSRRWDLDDTSADVHHVPTSEIGPQPVGAELDVYVYAVQSRTWGPELDENITVIRTVDGWIAA